MGLAAFFFILLSLWVQDAAATIGFTRGDFAQDFVFGAGTSAYQYEGAVAEDGRSPSFWDTFTHAGKMPDKSTGDIAADGYHKYKEDLKLVSETGLEAYRFSISWSRLIPNGRGAVNPKGLEYYNNIIDELVKHGIQIHITLHHVDLPQILEDEYGGWLSPRIIEDFTAYADICFREFGDRVTYWTTVNELNGCAIASYGSGQFPPGRCSDPFGITQCAGGNSSTEPYIAVHTTLLAHASVVKLYREKYKAEQKGAVGINIYSFWSYPFKNSSVDLEATQRAKDFMFGWILEPLVSGDYPEVMKKIVGSRLPSFTKVQSGLIKDSFDFFGINHYYSLYVSDRPIETGVRDFYGDMSISYRASRTGPPAGQGAPTNVPSDPKGLQLVLEYLKEAYGNPPLYVHENGVGSPNDSLNDNDRVEYLSSYMRSTLDAIRNGVNVRGYFVWAFKDLFELLAGYQSKYGLYRVDFDDVRRPRQARLSARWYSGFLNKNGSSLLLLTTQEGLMPK
ncbi:beta-glucosidase 5-like [Brachypodium distachyon]|uniref:beta-glucosidase 5-like n=1 Tax=Brachypodium distachyon TaxID=15368 RepID=UPI0001C74595|nr:beta-glucosidase 5-like [Brachypodium distachyon]|eukprot:XP_024316576.1 beta-glucosidase 5-like [Brachypodium distachyon]